MKIVVLARQGSSSSILLNWLIREGYTDLEVILEAEPKRFQQIRQRARRLGWRHVLGQAAFMVGAMPILRRQVIARRKQLLIDHDLDEAMPSVERIMKVETVNDPAVADYLREVGPTAVLVNGTRIIRPPVLKAISSPFINMHVGITPDYRGVHGGYWALWNKEPEKFGATVHLVDEGVDTGTILAQVTVRPGQHDNIASYPLLQQAKALEVLKELLEKLGRGEKLCVSSETSGQGVQWFHPTLLQYAYARLRGIR